MNPTNIKSVTLLFLVCAVLVVGLSLWIGGKSTSTELPLLDETQELDAPLSPEALKADNQVTKNTMNPKAIFKTSEGTFELELFEDQMPITVGNFVKLAESGFYNGTKFHRVIDGFMIQGGDPNSKTENTSSYGQGGPGYTIQDEFVAADNLSNVRGSIAMANTGQPNSGGSQFFINVGDNSRLDFNVPDPNDSKHPVFGHVVKGLDIVDAIESVQTGPNDLPTEPVVIESVTIQREVTE